MRHSIAHIRKSDGKEQSVSEHCQNVSNLAAEYLAALQLEHVGLLAGLLHDMGKCTEAFDTYIKKSVAGEHVIKGSVNHTFAGVIYLFENFYTTDVYAKLTCELIAYAVGAHHGLFDCLDDAGKIGFDHRVRKEKDEIFYDEAKENFLRECIDPESLAQCFTKGVREVRSFYERMAAECENKQTDVYYGIGLLARMILSALADADRSDTAAFMSGTEVQRVLADMTDIWKRQLSALENYIAGMNSDGAINWARQKISDLCRAFAVKGEGVYRLNVPTGGGKTLASLRYALAHAVENRKRRIFYIIPLLSIIEQNAGAIRDAIADPELILEHHSDVVTTTETSEEAGTQELLAENWLSPMVITTLVQFLNTLFLGKMSSIRRLHALCDSVILIDEIQTLPVRMISIFNLAVNFLVKFCHATVLLCSATQPTYEKVEHPIKFSEVTEIVSYDSALWQPFSRTTVVDKYRKEGYSIAELADFASELMTERENLLIICNTRTAAFDLYKQLASRCGDYKLFHLSTEECGRHRRNRLKQIKAYLNHHKRIICVSTQLVEAGVDFSFSCVIRCLAGMDSIAQAAGRCNRHGEFHRLCEVYIVNLREENLSYLPDIRNTQKATDSLLLSFRRESAHFANDLLSREAITYYYHKLFTDPKVNADFDYPIPEKNTKLLTLLSANHKWRALFPKEKPYPYIMGQAFRTAGEEFQVFDDCKVDVIVPYGKGKKVILDLLSEQAEHDLKFLKKKLKEAKPYTVSVFEYQLRRLEQAGGIEKCNGFICLQPRFYSKETGLDISGGCDSFCCL